MDINFKFSSLLGSVYKNGNVVFSRDGNSVFSPVGNKVTVFDLKNNVSRTLSLESSFSISAIAVNSHNTHLVVANEGGEILYVNLLTEAVVHRFRASRTINAMMFSPDSKYCGITRGGDLQVHEVFGSAENLFSPFLLKQTYHMTTELLTCVDWSHDSNLVVAGGEDRQVHIVGAAEICNLHMYTLGAQKAELIGVFFFKDSYDVVAVDRRGQANVWLANFTEADIVYGNFRKDEKSVKVAKYDKKSRTNVCTASGSGLSVDVTAAAFHPHSAILVTAFTNGAFVLFEALSFAVIHSLRVSELHVSTVSFNKTGDWLGIGCGKGSSAQLVVWEWQSETYVMKQQSHSLRVLHSRFSPDAHLLATAAEDGKVKIWNARSGFCIVTFSEHTSAATAVAWTQNGKAILSASLDGTVRARDIKRYRNFRTLVCPEQTQLGSLAVDASGDLVIASAKEEFQCFIWSMQNGQLLDVLSGHTAVIVDISMKGNSLASVSWDKTLRLWNVVDSSCETVDLLSEAVAVSFAPSEPIIAVLTIDSNVAFFHSSSLAEIGSIEARWDLDPSRLQNEKVKKETSAKSKCFTSLSFSPESSLLLLGGQSIFFCLYSVPQKILLRKFTLTLNRSLDGVVMDLNRRNLTEFGNIHLVDSEESDEEGGKRTIKLPGTRHGDDGERKGKPIAEVNDVTFCPTGRRFCISGTEGVAIYSLDTQSIFDPFQLELATSSDSVLRSINSGEYTAAIKGAIQLSDAKLLRKAVEETPPEHMEIVARSLSVKYVERLLKWMGDPETFSSSPHFHFYMIWLHALLRVHSEQLQKNSAENAAIIAGLQHSIKHHFAVLQPLALRNKYSLKYLCQSRRRKKEKKEEKVAQ